MVRFINKKIKDNPVLVVTLLVVVLFLLSKTEFMAALVTTCDNFEPVSINDFEQKIQELNGTFESLSSTMEVKEGISLQKYRANSLLGIIDVIDPYNYSCSEILNIIHQEDNESNLIRLNQRDVLIIKSGEYIWCNDANNIAMEASLQSYSNYYNQFEICTTIEIVDERFVDNEGECIQLRGEWIDDSCMCVNGTQLEIGDICPDPEGESVGGAAEDRTDTKTTSLITDELQMATDLEQKEEEETSRIFFGVMSILIVLFVIYWLFEKGPNKGFIKRRRKK